MEKEGLKTNANEVEEDDDLMKEKKTKEKVKKQELERDDEINHKDNKVMNEEDLDSHKGKDKEEEGVEDEIEEEDEQEEEASRHLHYTPLVIINNNINSSNAMQWGTDHEERAKESYLSISRFPHDSFVHRTSCKCTLSKPRNGVDPRNPLEPLMLAIVK